MLFESKISLISLYMLLLQRRQFWTACAKVFRSPP